MDIEMKLSLLCQIISTTYCSKICQQWSFGNVTVSMVYNGSYVLKQSSSSFKLNNWMFPAVKSALTKTINFYIHTSCNSWILRSVQCLLMADNLWKIANNFMIYYLTPLYINWRTPLSQISSQNSEGCFPVIVYLPLWAPPDPKSLNEATQWSYSSWYDTVAVKIRE